MKTNFKLITYLILLTILPKKILNSPIKLKRFKQYRLDTMIENNDQLVKLNFFDSPQYFDMKLDFRYDNWLIPGAGFNPAYSCLTGNICTKVQAQPTKRFYHSSI